MKEHARFPEADIILPVQYFGGLMRSRTETHGEWRLLYAVLDDAIHCFRRTAYSSNPRERALFAETAAWVMDDAEGNASRASGPEAGFWFVDVCTTLGIDPRYLRTRLWRWYRAQRSGRRPRLSPHGAGHDV